MSEEGGELESYARARLGTLLKGKYRLDSILGLGGMAVVYRATHRNQAEFAVKMLHPELSIREDVRSRFLREGYAANSVKHPGVVSVVDDDVAEDGAAFVVMELLDGMPCDSLVPRDGDRLPVRGATAIVTQLLDVLAAAHDKGIVHRDIKPANVFLQRDGRVKVLDFGIARVRDAAGTKTATGTFLGTPAFMPPEQAMAKSSEIDGQSDVWAAGATLFTLLSGRLVHDGDNASQIMIRAATQPAPPLHEACRDVPPAIAAVVDRALAFDKRDRWASAAAMREALSSAAQQALGAAPTSADVEALLRGPHAAAAVADTVLAPVSEPARSAPVPRSTAGAGSTTPAPVTRAVEVSSRSRPKALAVAAFVLAIGGLGVGASVVWPRLSGAPEGSAAGATSARLGAAASIESPVATSQAPPPPAPPPPASLGNGPSPSTTVAQRAVPLKPAAPPSSSATPRAATTAGAAIAPSATTTPTPQPTSSTPSSGLPRMEPK